MGAPAGVYRLIEQFDERPPKNETEARTQFVDPFFGALGWDVRDNRQVSLEPTVAVQVGGITKPKRPDYAFHIGKQTHFFVEAKHPRENLETNTEPAYQLRRYGWSCDTLVGILTDFEEFVIYDCRIEPKQHDPASKARLKYYRYSEYIDKWDEIAELISQDAVAAGSLKTHVDDSVRGFLSVDQAFLREMEQWRELLAKDIALFNRDLTQRQLNLSVQRTIDRIVFLRIAEDRNIEPYGRLQRAAANDQNVYEALKLQFNEADDKYNSGLFHFGRQERLAQPDLLALNINVSDEPLRQIIKNLYYPFSPYEFSVLPADILGQVYERFLGKVIDLGAGGGVRVEDKPEARKAGGVYYTPTYIVDYIVENTVGDLLWGKTPADASKLRILDPACGSGSFLTGAYQFLLDWHLEYYSQDPKRYQNVMREVRGRFVLTMQEKRRILQNNIYGVDLDENAVEVSKLSLLLKMLENEDGSDATGLQTMMFAADERILPDLSGNIKWGNSLIGSDFFDENQSRTFTEEERLSIKFFDWNSAEGYPDIIADGGFDVVIGNPPWGSKEVLPGDQLAYIAKKFGRRSHNLNIFAVFIDECIERLLVESGLLGLLIPKNFTKTEAYLPYRETLLSDHGLNMVVDFGQFPGVAQEAIGLFVTAKEAIGRPIRRIYVENQSFHTLDSLSVEDINGDKSKVITLARMPNLSPIARKVEAMSFNLGDHFEVGRGLEHGRKGNLIWCPHCGQHFERPGKRNKTLMEVKCKSCKATIDISTSRHDETFIFKAGEEYDSLQVEGLLVGNSIDRYQLKAIPYKVELDLQGINYKNLQNMKEKLYFIRIARSLRGYLDTDGLLALNALNFVYNTDPNVPYKLQYILGILNSQLLKSYIEYTVTGGANLTIRLSNALMRSLPIRKINFGDPAEVDMHDKMVTLVDRMLDLHRELSAMSGEARRIALAQIERTDREIDALVYRLYGLSEDEVALVEG